MPTEVEGHKEAYGEHFFLKDRIKRECKEGMRHVYHPDQDDDTPRWLHLLASLP